MFRHYLSLWIFQDTQVNCPDGEKIISCSCHLQSNVSECGSPKCIRKAVLCSGGDVILKKILGMTHVFTKAAKWQPKDSLPSNKLSPLSAHPNANKASPDKSVVLLAPEVPTISIFTFFLQDREVFCPEDGVSVACMCIQTAVLGHKGKVSENYGKPCSHSCNKKAILCSNGWILVRKFAPWLRRQEARKVKLST